MAACDQLNDWVEPYDLFISYARKDNETGMVSALVDIIREDFGRISPSQPLKVFFDKQSILDGQYWEDKIKKGLWQSKVMLAVLSEAYFNSEWCRREWEEYILVEQARTWPGEALTPIFIVAPEELGKIVPVGTKDGAWWKDVNARNAVVEIHPYWPRGREALQEQIVVDRLRRVQDNLQQRVELGRALANVPRNLRSRNPNFVGRDTELVRLRTVLCRHQTVGICALNGVGGIGKSTAAREYAYKFRPDYLGGQFEIDLSAIDSLQGLQDQVVHLARDYLKADIPPHLPGTEQHARAKAAFHGLPANHTALLILDNLNEADTSLVGRANLDRALPWSEKVHLLITTRAEPDSLGLGKEQTISLDTLSSGEALDLLCRYRRFAFNPQDPDYIAAREGNYLLSPAEEALPGPKWKAALAIVNRLGKHTLAISLVGAYLGCFPDVSYTQFTHDLAHEGIGLILDAVGNEQRVKNLIQHPVTLIGPCSSAP